MATEILQQPDGLFALYSHTTDILFGLDMDRKEVCEHFAERVAPHLREADIADTNRILDQIEAGGTHYEFPTTWKQALKQHTPGNCLTEEINKEVAKRKKSLKGKKKNAKDGG